MELETFKITVLPLRQKMLNFSRRLVEDAADAEAVSYTHLDVYKRQIGARLAKGFGGSLYFRKRIPAEKYDEWLFYLAKANERLPFATDYGA